MKKTKLILLILIASCAIEFAVAKSSNKTVITANNTYAMTDTVPGTNPTPMPMPSPTPAPTPTPTPNPMPSPTPTPMPTPSPTPTPMPAQPTTTPPVK